MQDATQLALKIVTSYGLSDLGITTYASPGTSLGYMRKSFEVAALTAALSCDCCSLIVSILSEAKLCADSAVLSCILS